MVENVLVAQDGTFKLCDFGSCTTQKIPAGLALKGMELERLREEIEKETTIQYRAPEMCDLLRRRGISEKVDVWALGVLLYKLCYFTTPFENDGQFAILNGRYEIPAQPYYTKSLTDWIRRMLQVDSQKRPNIFQVVRGWCELRRMPCPIQNIYPPEETADLTLATASIGGGNGVGVGVGSDQANADGNLGALLPTSLIHAYRPEELGVATVADTQPQPGVRRGRAKPTTGTGTGITGITGATNNQVSLDHAASFFASSAAATAAPPPPALLDDVFGSTTTTTVGAGGGTGAGSFFDVFPAAAMATTTATMNNARVPQNSTATAGALFDSFGGVATTGATTTTTTSQKSLSNGPVDPFTSVPASSATTTTTTTAIDFFATPTIQQNNGSSSGSTSQAALLASIFSAAPLHYGGGAPPVVPPKSTHGPQPFYSSGIPTNTTTTATTMPYHGSPRIQGNHPTTAILGMPPQPIAKDPFQTFGHLPQQQRK